MDLQRPTVLRLAGPISATLKVARPTVSLVGHTPLRLAIAAMREVMSPNMRLTLSLPAATPTASILVVDGTDLVVGLYLRPAVAVVITA